jgi:hypothetical protein
MQGSEVMPENHHFSHPRSRKFAERGASRFPFLLLLALTAAVVYLIIVFIPIYLGQMEESTAEIVRRGALQNLNEMYIRAQLQEKARVAGLPNDHQIQLWRDGRKLTARITYQQSVRFPFYTYKWPVEIRVADPPSVFPET